MKAFLNRTYWLFRTWYWRSRFVESMTKSLNRRVEVEQTLLNVAGGKRGPLTLNECRALAMKLGATDDPR